MVTSVSGTSPKWFAAYTASRHEKRVSTQLSERAVESFLPMYRTVHRWKNRTQAMLELPLFPSYVFVRIPANEKAAVLQVPGVLGLVGSSREAWPLPDSEIETLRAGLDQRKPEPHPYLVVGDRVRITSGPLAGMEGVLLQQKNALRVVLTLDRIMKSISVEVGLHEVERISRTAIAC
jgi:transcription antitermination factor NusG